MCHIFVRTGKFCVSHAVCSSSHPHRSSEFYLFACRDHEKCTHLRLCAKVTGVVGRAETLSSVFFIAAFMFYSQATKQRKQTSWRMMTLAVLSVATAMLCKEQGITILGVCFAYELFVTQKVSLVPTFFIKSNTQFFLRLGSSIWSTRCEQPWEGKTLLSLGRRRPTKD